MWNKASVEGRSRRLKRRALEVLLGVLLCAIPAPSLADTPRGMTGVVSKELVNASPEQVFQAIRNYRKSDTAKRQIVSEKTGEAVIHEFFPDVPVLGHVDCTYIEKEVPYSRIDYKLVTSEKLKVFEGCWTLTPMDGGKETLVRLMSYLNTDVNVPFKDFLTHIQMHNDIHKRLEFVKENAEKLNNEQKK